ncbi:MAG: FkbM family methyltransferase [Chloroflexi bacterium]|nr:FkbM family methyltransferase [Chloroflexota bacterium]
MSDPRNLFATERVGITSDGLKHWCLRENQIERSILDTGFWEPLETNAVKKHLQLGCVAFDIGANIGYFTLLMSKIVGDTGQVHCFEPTAYAFKRLQKNIALNPTLPSNNIILNNKGLSSHKVSQVESFESRFSARILAHDEKELIEFITLDHYFHSLKLDRVDFIKIDVDGYDYEVIKGGAAIFKKYKPVVLAEICNRVLKERGKDVTSYLKLYLEYGYSFCELLETTEVVALEELIKDSRMQSGSWNILLS